MGPGPKWAQGPSGPGPKWAQGPSGPSGPRAQVGPGPKWAQGPSGPRAQVGPGPKWARGPSQSDMDMDISDLGFHEISGRKRGGSGEYMLITNKGSVLKNKPNKGELPTRWIRWIRRCVRNYGFVYAKRYSCLWQGGATPLKWGVPSSGKYPKVGERYPPND